MGSDNSICKFFNLSPNIALIKKEDKKVRLEHKSIDGESWIQERMKNVD